MQDIEDPAEPTLVRRRLGRQLRDLRVAAGRSHSDVEAAGLGHRTTTWRIEAGRERVRPSTVRALCWLYEADEVTADVLYTMACQAVLPARWARERDVLSPSTARYVELEAVAVRVGSYRPTTVDPLLQTPAYARAVITARLPSLTPRDVDREVTVLRERQERALDRSDPLQLSVVLCESVLLRPIGGRRVLFEQLDRLGELNERDRLRIHVLPLDAGAHPAPGGPFCVLDLSDDGSGVVHVETVTGGVYLDAAPDLEGHRAALGALGHRSVPLEELLDPPADLGPAAPRDDDARR